MLQRHERLAFAGSIHFVTTTTSIRGRWFISPDICTKLLTCFEAYRAKYDVECMGYVLMPDHFHVLLVQSSADPLIPLLMKGFKQFTSRQCKPRNYPNEPLWHYRYDDVPVPGSRAAQTKLEYMHNNPVKRELVTKPENYLWSSAQEYINNSMGLLHVKMFR